MLDALLHAVRASRRWFAWWPPIDQLVSTQLSEASPRALTLVSPYVDWYPWMDSEDFVQWWVAGVSAVPYTEEVAQGVVDMLLRIAPDDKLVSHIPVDLWLWLTRQPPLPPVCKGRRYGTHGSAVEVVRGVKNIEVLKSYFLLVWSEWDALQSSGFDNICASIREDFGGVGMRHHREDLTKRLDHVLGQLDYGLDHFKQRDPEFWIGALRKRRRQYRELKEVLLEVERCTSSATIMYFCMLTCTGSRATFSVLCLSHPDAFTDGTSGLSFSAFQLHSCGLQSLPLVGHFRALFLPVFRNVADVYISSSDREGQFFWPPCRPNNLELVSRTSVSYPPILVFYPAPSLLHSTRYPHEYRRFIWVSHITRYYTDVG